MRYTQADSFNIQTCDAETALYEAGLSIRLARLSRLANHKYFPKAGDLAKRRMKVAQAYLNRACELACVPLAQHYVETQLGLDLAWVTYRPEAIPNEPYSSPAAIVFLGYVDEVSEDQARSRAIGW